MLSVRLIESISKKRQKNEEIQNYIHIRHNINQNWRD